MVVASRVKASDRATLLKKLFPIIKKHYKVHIPKGGKPVLETMLYAICLEDSTVEEAELSFKRLFSEFPDLNEVRVSTVAEIERAFQGQTASEWRAYRVISVLKFVFDKNYAFEFEGLRKKTLDLATKQLAKIKELTPFVRDYTLHEVTGAHLVPIEPSTMRLLIWLGMAMPNQSHDQIAELMKGAVRKAEVEGFLYTIRGLATDPKLCVAFDTSKYPAPDAGHDLDEALDRLARLMKNGPEKPKPQVKPAVEKKAAPGKPVAKAAAAKKKTAAPAPVSAPAKPAAKKPVPAKKPPKKAK